MNGFLTGCFIQVRWHTYVINKKSTNSYSIISIIVIKFGCFFPLFQNHLPSLCSESRPQRLPKSLSLQSLKNISVLAIWKINRANRNVLNLIFVRYIVFQYRTVLLYIPETRPKCFSCVSGSARSYPNNMWTTKLSPWPNAGKNNLVKNIYLLLKQSSYKLDF